MELVFAAAATYTFFPPKIHLVARGFVLALHHVPATMLKRVE